MKSLFTTTYFYPYISGLSAHPQRLAEELVKNGHEITVLCMKHDKKLPDSEIRKGVKIIRAKPLVRVSKGFLSVNWIKLLIDNLKTVSVVTVNLPQPEGWVAAGLGKLMGKRVVAVYHCNVVVKNKTAQWIINCVNWAAMTFSDKVVAYSEDYAYHTPFLKNFRSKTEIILPPIPEIFVDREYKKELVNKIGQGVIIGVAARMAREKGIEYLLEAIPLLKKTLGNNIRVAIAGPTDPVGEEDYKNKILKIINKFKKNVVLLGAIPQDKMGAFYSCLDILVLPSLDSTEAFGLVQVEAMKCGVPVVASNLPGVRVPIQMTGAGMLIPIRNSKQISVAISQMVQKKIQVDTKKIDDLFSLHKTVMEFERVLI